MALRGKARPVPADEVAFAALRRAHEEGRIVLFTDAAVICQPGSPAYSVIDVFAPPLVLLASSITLLFAFGMLQWIVGLVFVLLYQAFVQPRLVLWRAHRRAQRYALAHLVNLKLFWESGGIAVALKEWPERNCIAPQGDWRVFAADYLLDAGSMPVGGAG